MGAQPDYGVLKDTVAIAGSLIAAAGAISFTWIRRAKWMPPDETVEKGTLRVAGVVCAVVIGTLYLYRKQLGPPPMTIIAGICVLVILIALSVSIYVNTTYGFVRKVHLSRSNTSTTRFLGGWTLTHEAAAALQKNPAPTIQYLFDISNNRPDAVWTRKSQAHVQIVSTIGFIALQASGSIALAAIAMAISEAK